MGTPAASDSRKPLFLNTSLVSAIDPKGIAFFVAFLPQLLDAASPVVRQPWPLAGTFVVFSTVNSTPQASVPCSRSARVERSPARETSSTDHGGDSRS